MRKLSIKLFIFLIILSGCMTKAQKAFMKGDRKFKQGEYVPAIEYFKSSLEKGYPDKAGANYYIAESYRLSNKIQESEPYYKAAIDNKSNQEEVYFYYAMAQKAAGNYPGAEATFKNYTKIGTNFDLKNRAKNEIENLKDLVDIVNKKSYFSINKIEHLNTPEEEYAPFYFKDKLYFTSSRGSEKVHNMTGTGFTDLYEFIFDGVDKHSGQARPLSEVINTEDAHEASVIFTKDGKTMYFARGNTGSKKGPKDVDIYMSTLGPDGAWTEPQKLPFNDDLAWDSSPALSSDEKVLYFASNREGGNGGTDLYKVIKNPDGTWGAPVNLGTPINTRGNEMYPYEAHDKAFYFASDGHPSLGKLDLFIVRKDPDNKKKPTIENLGKPINTSFDDFAMCYRDSVFGYFSSDRPGGEGGDDIYEFKDESRVKIVHYWLNLQVKYTEEKSPGKEFPLPDATVKLINHKGDTISSKVSDEAGKIKFEVDPEANYSLLGSKPGHYSEKLEITTGKRVKMDTMPFGESNVYFPEKYVLILPKEEEITIVIENIYYGYDSANITTASAMELNKIVDFMKINPDIKIELSSHTDARGSDKYNEALSQRRADSAVAYIVKQGIGQDRITAKGYGEYKPLVYYDSTSGKEIKLTEKFINSLSTKARREAAHKKNRRTEIRITDTGTKKHINIRRKDEGFEMNIKEENSKGQ